MNPSPDRGKEFLPPKKRESRQGSSEQRPAEDDFKHPAPLRSRRQHLSEGRESGSGGGGSEQRFHKDLLPPPPPPLPPLQPLPLALPPWQPPYPSPVHHPYLPSQSVREVRRGSGSPSWRIDASGRGSDSGTEHQVAHHSRWSRTDIPPLTLQPPPISAYAVDSRDVWPYFNLTRRDYSSSLFSSTLPFPQPSLYPPDLLTDSSRLRYTSRRPNGLDGPGSRSESSGRQSSGADYGNDTRSRLGASHSNGRKRQQEDAVGHSTARGPLPLEGSNTHSSLHNSDRDPLGTAKAPTPNPYASEARTGKAAAPPDPPVGSASQTGAQIYYALGSLYPQVYTNLSPSGPHHPPSLRNSQHSPHTQANSHTGDQEREPPPSPGSYRPSLSVLSGPDPPPSTVLPHFAKGSLIELAGGRLKRVEELRTDDFLHSADTSPDFHLSTCTILQISPGPTNGFNHLQVLLADRNTQELLTVLEEYPFFVQERGWSSCSPQRSAQLYGLQCRQLSTGDVCLALTPTPVSPRGTSNRACATTSSSSSTTTAAIARAQRTQGRPVAPLDTGAHRSDDRMPPPPPPPPPLPSPLQLPPPSAPPLPSLSQSENQEKPRPRKRRWSAPDLQGGDRACPDLPQGCKQVRQQ